MSEKLAVFFPGIGYTNDKPLLYYSQRMLRKAGYEILTVDYTGFDNGIKGNKEKMLKAFETGLGQAEEILEKVDFQNCGDIVFISKSIGTAIAAKYALDRGLKVRNIYFTPLEYTFMHGMQPGIAFIGTADPWVENRAIKDCCEEYHIPLTIIEGGNHSLETDDIFTNIDILKVVMFKTGEYLGIRAQ